MPGKQITREAVLPKDFLAVLITPDSRVVQLRYQPRLEGFPRNYTPEAVYVVTVDSDPIIAELVDRLFHKLAIGATRAEGMIHSPEELAEIDQQIADVKAERAPFALGDEVT